MVTQAKPAKNLTGFKTLPIAKVVPNVNQPRKHFDEDALDELAVSITEHGLMQPIVVRPIDGGNYQIVAGERRWRASQRAGLDTIDARIMSLDDETAFILSVTENVSRQDMTPMEEANAYGELVKLGKTPADLAGMFGKTEFMIKLALSLLDCIEQVQWLVTKGHLPVAIATSLALLSPEGQQAVLKRYQDGRFATNDEVYQYCRVVQATEAQGQGLLAQVMPSENPITEARRKARRGELERAWEKVEKLSAALTPFMETTPEDIAFAFATEAPMLSRKMRVLFSAINRTRKQVNEAAALAQVAAVA